LRWYCDAANHPARCLTLVARRHGDRPAHDIVMARVCVDEQGAMAGYQFAINRDPGGTGGALWIAADWRLARQLPDHTHSWASELGLPLARAQGQSGARIAIAGAGCCRLVKQRPNRPDWLRSMGAAFVGAVICPLRISAMEEAARCSSLICTTYGRLRPGRNGQLFYLTRAIR
jgi:hypothetical protein